MARDRSRDGTAAGRRIARRHERGYTLVELMLVVFIVAVMAGVAGVASGASESQHLDMAEIQIRDALAWAQSQARSNRVAVAVVFDPGNDRFTLVDASGAVLPDPLTRSEYLVSFHRPNQPRLVDVVAADFGACGRAVIFDAQGVPMTGGSITLASSPDTRVLTVDAATGSITSS
jgi:prepilin-type N-terminal cleavage/methylation domain-containing protein